EEPAALRIGHADLVAEVVVAAVGRVRGVVAPLSLVAQECPADDEVIGALAGRDGCVEAVAGEFLDGEVGSLPRDTALVRPDSLAGRIEEAVPIDDAAMLSRLDPVEVVVEAAGANDLGDLTGLWLRRQAGLAFDRGERPRHLGRQGAELGRV